MSINAAVIVARLTRDNETSGRFWDFDPVGSCLAIDINLDDFLKLVAENPAIFGSKAGIQQKHAGFLKARWAPADYIRPPGCRARLRLEAVLLPIVSFVLLGIPL